MKKEIADQWVAALRSGRYSQGDGALSKEDDFGRTFCCLGVLCDLSRASGVGEWFDRDVLGLFSFECNNQKSHALDVPPEPVQQWAGLSGGNPEVPGTGDTDAGRSPLSLAELNDGGRSFAEIADLIEKHWESL